MRILTAAFIIISFLFVTVLYVTVDYELVHSDWCMGQDQNVSTTIEHAQRTDCDFEACKARVSEMDVVKAI